MRLRLEWVRRFFLSLCSAFADVDRRAGIHNEPGFVKKTLPTAAALVDELLTKLTATDDAERSYLDFKRARSVYFSLE